MTVARITSETTTTVAAGLTRVQAPREYEELDGAQGREVFFRPQRFRPDELTPLKIALDWHREGVAMPCPVVDLSQGGFAFECLDGVVVRAGDTLHGFVLTVDDEPVYSGEVRVSATRVDGNVTVVGASYRTGELDIDDILQLRDVKSWGGQGDRRFDLPDANWRVDGNHEFRALVSEFRLYLDDAGRYLNNLESSLPWRVLHDDTDTPARRAVMTRVRAEFVPEFVRYTEQIDAALRLAKNDDEKRALKEFSLRHLQDHFMSAPFMERCRSKPLGYPGDFECMRFLYERQFEGVNLLAKAIHMGSVLTRGAEAVRQRKDLIKSLMINLIRSWTRPEPLRIASIAAGPAHEVAEMLRDWTGPMPQLEIVLFDQDKLALTHAHARVHRLADRFGGAVKVTYLHDSIKRLLNDPMLLSGFGPFELIFSCGLYDYLRFNTAATLCRHMFANLTEGGQLYVGNMVPENPCRWFLEHHLEWFLLYREPSELLDYGRAADASAELSIVKEATGINPFLVMRKV